jgi:hypothetical protein
MMNRQKEVNDRNREIKRKAQKVNDGLYAIGLKYWDYIPVYEMDSLLVENGFDATEAGIYCGTDSKIHEHVGAGKFFSMSYHKMESGRFEIVAYLN